MASATFERFDEVFETQTRNVFHTLSELDRRRFAAIQARQLGYGISGERTLVPMHLARTPTESQIPS